jgi:hypothetical protein
VDAYVRVSPLRQFHECNPIEHRKSMIALYMEMNTRFTSPSIESLECYIEPDRSAKRINHSRVRPLMLAVATGLTDIIVWI